MKTVKNLSRKPVVVPLPRGKTLHLGPAKTGQISAESAEHAGVKRLVADGTLELVDDGSHAVSTVGGGRGAGAGRRGAGWGRPRKSGDR